MKYIAILDSDDELSEDTINELKETVFVGDEKTPYCFEFTSIKEEPKALEKEPCEDAVSRKAMLDAITEIDDNINMDIYTNEVREIIGDLPSVTPTREEIVRCKDCKHRPVDTGKQIEPPEENGRIDETCPCINADDWWYSFMPEDDYFCADGERKV